MSISEPVGRYCRLLVAGQIIGEYQGAEVPDGSAVVCQAVGKLVAVSSCGLITEIVVGDGDAYLVGDVMVGC